MSEIREWRVIRQHEGDRFYNEGDTRTGTVEKLGHLAPRCLELLPLGKAEIAPLNKAENAAPANKASTGRKAK